MGLSPQGASYAKLTRTLRSRLGVVVQRKTSLFRWVTNRKAGLSIEDQGAAGGGGRRKCPAGLVAYASNCGGYSVVKDAGVTTGWEISSVN